jgi:hypothetical protein
MTRERWGTFSVKDHKMPRAFVADVLLYDRLIIPTPSDPTERERWFSVGWSPDTLDKKLELLGDRSIHVPWYQFREEEFMNRYKLNEGVLFDTNNISAAIDSKIDLLYMTRSVLANERLPKLPPGVSKIWPIAAYPAFYNYKEERTQKAIENKEEELAMMLSQRFLVPDDDGKSDDELLLQAIQLSSDDDFRKKRQALFEWQDGIIEQKIPAELAIKEMEDLLTQYNEILRKSRLKLTYKYAFLAIEVAVAIAGAKLGDPIATTAALAGITKFAVLDRKLDINAGDCKAAAMMHDFENKFKR